MNAEIEKPLPKVKMGFSDKDWDHLRSSIDPNILREYQHVEEHWQCVSCRKPVAQGKHNYYNFKIFGEHDSRASNTWVCAENATQARQRFKKRYSHCWCLLIDMQGEGLPPNIPERIKDGSLIADFDERRQDYVFREAQA